MGYRRLSRINLAMRNDSARLEHSNIRLSTAQVQAIFVAVVESLSGFILTSLFLACNEDSGVPWGEVKTLTMLELRATG